MDLNESTPDEWAARILEAAKGTFWDRLGCRLVHASRKMITAEAKVTDEAGALCAWGSDTFRLLSETPERRDN